MIFQQIEFLNQVSYILFSFGIIVIAGNISGLLFKKINLPPVAGQLLSGILIGPYFLGSFPLPFFKFGIFPLSNNTVDSIPISPGLFSIVVIAFLLILFILGLETNLSFFSKYTKKGFIIAVSGIVLSFIATLFICNKFLQVNILSIKCITFAIIASVSSLSITSKIIFERQKINSKEKFNIVSSVLIENMIIIFIFAILIILFIINKRNLFSNVNFNNEIFSSIPLIISLFTIILITFLVISRLEHLISLGKFYSFFAAISFGVILLIASLIEKTEFTIIILPYILGLALSKTNINFYIRDTLRPFINFLMPVLFVIVGMLFDVNIVFSSINFIGIVIIIICVIIISKFIGNFIPTIFIFKKISNAAKVSFGMIPRFELSLIIGTICYSQGLIIVSEFNVIFLLVLVTSIIVPLIYNIQGLYRDKSKKLDEKDQDNITNFDIPSNFVRKIIITRIVDAFKTQGFSVNQIELDDTFYYIRREETLISIKIHEKGITIINPLEEVGFIKNLIVDVILDIDKSLDKMTKPFDKDFDYQIGKNEKKIKKTTIELEKLLNEKNIILALKADTKNEAIEEIVNMLYANGEIINKTDVLNNLLEREKIISTGMQYGIAIPHCKTNGIDKQIIAIGIKKEGINFNSIDNKPSNIIVMFLTPDYIFSSEQNLRTLVHIASILNKEEIRNKILNATSKKEIWDLLIDNE